MSHCSDGTIENFFADFDIDIHNSKYAINGTSKANKLRTFWKIDSDLLVGKVTLAMIDDIKSSDAISDLITECTKIAERLLAGIAGKVDLSQLKEKATTFNLQYMQTQIRRIEPAVETDPDLAISTSKEIDRFLEVNPRKVKTSD